MEPNAWFDEYCSIRTRKLVHALMQFQDLKAYTFPETCRIIKAKPTPAFKKIWLAMRSLQELPFGWRNNS